MNFVVKCLVSAGVYACLSAFLYRASSLGFSPTTPRGDGKEQSPTAHRHAAYKFMVLPFVEIYATYLAFGKFGFSLGNAFRHLAGMASDPDVAKDALLQPLDASGVYTLDLYRVSFFLGTFHYWHQRPFSRDRVCHKVLATILSFIGFHLGDAGGVLDICILLWKPAGALESIFTLMYLRGLHKTPPGKAYVVFCTAFVVIDRWIFEVILLAAMMKALVSFPGELLFDCWQRLLAHACFAALTLLHLKWAYRSLRTLPSYLFGEGSHGLRFTETIEDNEADKERQKTA